MFEASLFLDGNMTLSNTVNSVDSELSYNNFLVIMNNSECSDNFSW